MKSILLIVLVVGSCFFCKHSPAQTTLISGPAGSGDFGKNITVLSNGNYLINDPFWDNGNLPDVGAVYLYSGKTHALISTLTGSVANDRVGLGGIMALKNGNFVVNSYEWNSGFLIRAGAVTWGSGTTGINGTVSGINSLVGTTSYDQVGGGGITQLPNSNYVVSSYYWSNGTAPYAGAATWGSGTSGITGPVSATNSLVGTDTLDMVSSSTAFQNSIQVMLDGSYTVISNHWNNGNASEAGAVTWGSSALGVKGAVSVTNSLVGTQTNDRVGLGGVVSFPGGKYAVISHRWNNGSIIQAGAVTLSNGPLGIAGVVSTANSLVGTYTDNFVGFGGVKALPNGAYVVVSYYWSNDSQLNRGAVTFCKNATGMVDSVSASNSLVGSHIFDYAGSGGITVLANGNYVVNTPYWNRQSLNATGAGAITWGNGTTGTTGMISATNSLTGSGGLPIGGAYNFSGVTPLTNGNYIVNTPQWSGNNLNAGAVTWCNGTTGTFGAISGMNSLIGNGGDRLGDGGITPLANGNYVINSPYWQKNSNISVGAVTWGNGSSGITGTISTSNSLIGDNSGSSLGKGGIKAFSNSQYVISSPQWSSGAFAELGAVTLANGNAGIQGTVSASNSLIGAHNFDRLGSGGVKILSDNAYLVISPGWNFGNPGSTSRAGAVTWNSRVTGRTGYVSDTNSLIGLPNNTGQVGYNNVEVIPNAGYIVQSPDWKSGVNKASAVSFSYSGAPLTGQIDSCNSYIGFYQWPVYYTQYDTVNKNLIIGDPFYDHVAVFNPFNRLIPFRTTSVSKPFLGTGIAPFANDSCQLLLTLTIPDTAFIGGAVAATVYVQNSTPQVDNSAYVRRYYKIAPTQSTDSVAVDLTLYFSQAEFDDYNANNGADPDLPAGPGDVAGIASLKVTQHRGTSATGLPGSFTTSVIPAGRLLNPDDNNILWNAAQDRWEVTFEATGFGGFFIHGSTGTVPLSTNNSAAKTNFSKGAVLFPNPAHALLTVQVEDRALLGTSAAVLNLQGSVLQTVSLKSLQQSVPVAHLPAGFYFVKLANGEVLKFAKD